MYRFFLLIYFLVYVHIQPGYGQAPPAFSFTHYGIENGLASNEIFSITQNQSGYLWIAANNGLQRFDGVHYKTFRHREQAGNKKALGGKPGFIGRFGIKAKYTLGKPS